MGELLGNLWGRSDPRRLLNDRPSLSKKPLTR